MLLFVIYKHCQTRRVGLRESAKVELQPPRLLLKSIGLNFPFYPHHTIATLLDFPSNTLTHIRYLLFAFLFLKTILLSLPHMYIPSTHLSIACIYTPLRDGWIAML